MASEQFVINIRTKGAKRSAADIRKIGKSANQVRKTLAFLRSALVVFAAIRIFSGLVKGIATFSQAMATVKAVTGATATEFKRLKDEAKRLGITTRFTATEAAEGMVALGRAGFETGEILDTVGNVLRLAQAGALSLARAADITTGILKGFGLAAAESGRVVDILAFAATSTKSTVEELGSAMSFVGNSAQSLGVSLETTAAAVGALAEANIKGSRAGTGLRTIFIKLLDSTPKATKTLIAMGLSAKSVDIATRGLIPVIETLAKKNLGLVEAGKLVGIRQANTLLALISQIKKLKELDVTQDKVAGTAAKIAKIMDESLQGALLAVKSAAEGVLLAFAEIGAESALTNFFRGLASVLRTVARNIDILIDSIAVFLAILIARKVFLFAAAITSVGVASLRSVRGVIALNLALIKTGRTSLLVGANFRLLRRAITKVPWGAVVLGVALAGGALFGFRKEISLTDDDTVNLGDTFDVLQDRIFDSFGGIGRTFKRFVLDTDNFVKNVGLGITRLIANFFGLKAALSAIFNNILISILKLAKGFLNQFNAILRGINAIRKIAGEGAVKFLKVDVLDTMIKNLERAGTDVVKAFNTAGRKFVDAVLAKGSARATKELQEFRDNLRRVTDADLALRPPKKKVKRAPIPPRIGADDNAKKLADEIARLTQALRSLEGSVFPLIQAQNALAETMKIINDAGKKGITLNVTQEDLLKRVRRQQLGLGQSTQQLAEFMKVLDADVKAGNISLREREVLARNATIAQLEGQKDVSSGISRAFLKLTKESTDAAAFSEKVFTDAFAAIGDAVADFVKTGKFSLNDFFRNFAAQLLKLGTNQAIAGIGGVFAGLLGDNKAGVGKASAGSAAGIGGLITSLFSSAFSSSASTGPASFGFGNDFTAFASGGSFKVGGNTAVQNLPGVDNRLIAFRARDGENVTVTPKGGGTPASGGGVTVIQNITTPDADSFNRSRTQNFNRLSGAITRANQRR